MITQSELKERLHYCPDTGAFTWLNPKSNCKSKGDKAGTMHHTGYLIIQIDKFRTGAHRWAFLYMTGSMPIEMVDHENQVRSDNRWSNLREVDRSGNQKNRSINKNNTSGFTGVRWHAGKEKWEVTISHNASRFYLGSFKDKSEAITARKAANIKYGYHPNHGAT